MNVIVSSEDSEAGDGLQGMEPVPAGGLSRMRLFLLWFWTVNVAAYLVCLVKFGVPVFSM